MESPRKIAVFAVKSFATVMRVFFQKNSAPLLLTTINQKILNPWTTNVLRHIETI